MSYPGCHRETAAPHGIGNKEVGTILNQAQQQAVSHGVGPCLVLAGPGSGKTHTLVERIRYMVCGMGIAPDKILVLTFTRAAAKEMKERFTAGMQEVCPVTFGTFHSVFYHILQVECHLSSQDLLTGEAARQLLREAVAECGIPWEEEFAIGLAREISGFSNRIQATKPHTSQLLSASEFQQVYAAYQSLKERYRKIDLDDMMQKTFQLFSRHPQTLEKWRRRFSFFLLDEVQDMNPLQWEILYQMAAPDNHIFAVGDDDQSIYGFRGASPQFMMDFPKRCGGCTVICLSVNYRCPKDVIAASGRLILHNKERFSKETDGVREHRGRIETAHFGTPEEEGAYVVDQIRAKIAQGYAYRDIAVLYRNHTQSLTLLRQCREASIPVEVKNSMPNPYRHWVMLDLEAYLNMALDLKRQDALRVMNRPCRYLSRASVDRDRLSFDGWIGFYEGKPWIQERIAILEGQIRRIAKMSGFAALNYIRKGIGYDDFLREFAKDKGTDPEELLQQADLFCDLAKGTPDIRALLTKRKEVCETAEQWGKKTEKSDDAVGFYTLHGAKGLEFPIVFLLDMNEGVLPSSRAVTPEQVEEERRLCYVGMTRTREELYLGCIRQTNNKTLVPSRFLREMQEGGACGHASVEADSTRALNASSTAAYSVSS